MGERTMRIGFDVGGTKIAAIALDAAGRELARARRAVPRDYGATLTALGAMSDELQAGGAGTRSIGIAMPGMIGRDGEPIRVVNLPWLEGRPLGPDLERARGVPVRIANDANCFALSEAIDGAAAGARVVFGATLGTGVGGAIVVDGRVLAGANAIAGEWGHNPLALPDGADGPPVRCGCGRLGCIESWLNGGALVRDYEAAAGRRASAARVATQAANGERAARGALDRYLRRLALALAGVVNLLDPDVIVLGGSLSTLPGLYDEVPRLWRPAIVAPAPRTRLVAARFGPESGLRGAAWLSAGTV